MTEQTKDAGGVINWSAALDATGGDEALLVDLLNIFLEESATLMTQIRQAIERQDYVLLNRAGHTLKGGLRIFESSKAIELARQLEFMARELAQDQKDVDKGSKDASVITPERIAAAFADAPRVVAELEPQLERVIAEMKTRLGP
jgi:HPt (histidine-containing phosphotransfer) domain-containing protein